jgi:hypothetical protein
VALATGKAFNALKQEAKRAELARARTSFGVLVEAVVAKAFCPRAWANCCVPTRVFVGRAITRQAQSA